MIYKSQPPSGQLGGGMELSRTDESCLIPQPQKSKPVAAVVPRQQWAGRIAASWRQSVEAVIETGKLLLAAKRALPGEFEAMIERDLPFGPRTARMLMAIAADQRLRNHGSVLPASWRTLYELTRLNDATFARWIANGTIHPEMERSVVHNYRAQGTGWNDWHTPRPYLDAARAVLGEIDLDPASSEAAQFCVRAKRFFVPKQDGLKQPWQGRVWLNPPYSQPLIAQFVSKLVSEWWSGRIAAAIMLTHNHTDTAWFHEAMATASAIRFTRGRIKFVDANGREAAPTQGQAFFYFGNDVARFEACFGLVLARRGAA